MDKAFPPCAIFYLDFARGCRGVGRKVAVLAVADRADRLFKVARLTVVYAAVMRAGIAALGALAVNIGIMSVGLDNAFFTVNKGDVFGLVGTNGSGKSTLLKAISGILKPYKGEIVVNGTISPLLELGAGFDMNLTARENIFLNGTVLGHSKKYMQEHFDEIVEFSELHKFLDSPVKNFSSGMRARLGFSIATIVRPDILIVDEILAVGDYSFQQKCLKRMDEMMGGGTTLLFVSHSIDQVRKLCDHAVWINKGQIMQIGEVNEVCDAYMATQKK